MWQIIRYETPSSIFRHAFTKLFNTLCYFFFQNIITSVPAFQSNSFRHRLQKNMNMPTRLQNANQNLFHFNLCKFHAVSPLFCSFVRFHHFSVYDKCHCLIYSWWKTWNSWNFSLWQNRLIWGYDLGIGE